VPASVSCGCLAAGCGGAGGAGGVGVPVLLTAATGWLGARAWLLLHEEPLLLFVCFDTYWRAGRQADSRQAVGRAAVACGCSQVIPCMCKQVTGAQLSQTCLQTRPGCQPCMQHVTLVSNKADRVTARQPLLLLSAEPNQPDPAHVCLQTFEQRYHKGNLHLPCCKSLAGLAWGYCAGTGGTAYNTTAVAAALRHTRLSVNKACQRHNRSPGACELGRSHPGASARRIVAMAIMHKGRAHWFACAMCVASMHDHGRDSHREHVTAVAAAVAFIGHAQQRRR
jgi:hypothetical protein